MLQAVEQRDMDTLAAIYHPQVEFWWPPGLPYGGHHRPEAIAAMAESFRATWLPLQPTPALRALDWRIVAANDREVVAQYTLKGAHADGRQIAVDTLALYAFSRERLARARMHHFDLLGLLDFLGWQ